MVTTVSKVDGVKQEKKVAPKKSTSQRTIQQTHGEHPGQGREESPGGGARPAH